MDVSNRWFSESPISCPTSPNRGFTDRLLDFDVSTGTVEQRTKQIVPGHWTTLTATVEDLEGHAIRPDPFDRIDLPFLPGDANNIVNTADYTRIVDVLSATYTPGDNSLHDQTRNSSITTADKTREQALLNGTKTTRAWNGYTLPARP